MIPAVVALAVAPSALAQSAPQLYWTNYGGGTIGAANLDGTSVNQSYLDTSFPEEIAVDGQHIYWANLDSNTIDEAADFTVKRANRVVAHGTVKVRAGHVTTTPIRRLGPCTRAGLSKPDPRRRVRPGRRESSGPSGRPTSRAARPPRPPPPARSP